MENQSTERSLSRDLLVDRGFGGNFEFFKTLIRKQFPGLQSFDDLVQDTLIRIWSKQHLFDPNKSSFLTWSTRVCIYPCLDHLRKLKTKPTNGWNDFDLCYSTASSEAIGLISLADSLENCEREVIDLAYFRGFTNQEIADYINIPLGTVKTRIIRGIKKLRHYFP
ncbi:MAG: RNA polymerase sigma factor [Saprospiraceae bacterium]|nr:RNA polymerase sigma factor [Saprospiraceae bacterium]